VLAEVIGEAYHNASSYFADNVQCNVPNSPLKHAEWAQQVGLNVQLFPCDVQNESQIPSVRVLQKDLRN
jgi:hypothetical protein